MRVLVNLLQCHREFTGTGRYVRNVLSAIAKLDIESEYVLIVSDDNYDAYQLDQTNFRQFRVPIDIRKRSTRILYEQLMLPSGLSSFRGSETVLWGPNDVPLLRWSGKQVVTVHDVRRLLHPQQFGLVERLYYRAMMRASVTQAAHVLTVSETSKRDICTYYDLSEDRVSVATNAVDPVFKPVPSESAVDEVLRRLNIHRPFVLFVGAQLTIKSPHILVDAFSRLSSGQPDLELVLVGKPGNATPLITATISKANLRRVRLIPWVPDSDLRCLLAAASVFAFPTQYEGFGIPPLEAMACGTPVVTTRLSCMPEVCGDAAAYCERLSPDGLADAIRSVLTDAPLRARLVRAGYENVSRFSWQTSAQTILKVLRQTAAA